MSAGLHNKYYCGPLSTSPTRRTNLVRFRKFEEGILPNDYWIVVEPKGEKFDAIYSRYRAGLLTIIQRVYAKPSDLDNPDNWE